MFARLRRPWLAVSLSIFACTAISPAARAAPGDTIWVDRASGDPPRTTQTRDLVLSPDGSLLFVVGETQIDGRGAVRVVAYDAASGEIVWRRLHEAAASGKLALSPDGTRLFLTGINRLSSADVGVFVVAFDAVTGTRLWRRSSVYEQRSDSPLPTAIVARTSVIFVSVGTDGPSRLYALDGDTGEHRWLALGGGKHSSYVQDLVLRGRMVIAGGTRVDDLEDFRADAWIVAHDTRTGNRIWSDRFRSSGIDHVADLEVSPDRGTVYAVGGFDGGVAPDYDHQLFVRALTATDGEMAWTWRSARHVGNADYAGVLVASTGSIYVSYPVDSVATLRAFGPDGASLWSRPARANDPDVDVFPIAPALSPDGRRIYVTGTGRMTDDVPRGLITFAVDAARGGDPVWYRHRPSGRGFDIAVSPDSTAVYVAGVRRLVYASYVEAFTGG